MSTNTHDFEMFMKQREQAAKSYVQGDAAPLDELTTHHSPATFFGPQGGYVENARSVNARYDKDAKAFEKGSDSHFEILHMASSGDLGYWVGLQKASAHMKGADEPIPFNLRITELYRFEDGEWKLIHRHADPLAEEKQPDQE